MNCEEVVEVLDAYVDGELAPDEQTSLQQHLAGCRDCSLTLAEIHSMSARIGQAGGYPVPKTLKGRIRGALGEEKNHGTGQVARWFRLRTVASHCAAGAIGGLLVVLLWTTVAERNSDLRNVVDAHVRGVMATQFASVESSDPHNVRPWFTGKIDYAPVVIDLTAEGFPLLGGRVDYLHGHPLAALTYGRRKHVITVFVAPAAASRGGGAVSGSVRGYQVKSWKRGAFSYQAVSDIDLTELARFAGLLRSRAN